MLRAKLLARATTEAIATPQAIGCRYCFMTEPPRYVVRLRRSLSARSFPRYGTARCSPGGCAASGRCASPPARDTTRAKIGRASCRERGGQYGEISGGAVSLKKKKKLENTQT